MKEKDNPLKQLKGLKYKIGAKERRGASQTETLATKR